MGPSVIPKALRVSYIAENISRTIRLPRNVLNQFKSFRADIGNFTEYLKFHDSPTSFQQIIRDGMLSQLGPFSARVIFLSPEDVIPWGFHDASFLLKASDHEEFRKCLPSGFQMTLFDDDGKSQKYCVVDNSLDNMRSPFTLAHELAHSNQSIEAILLRDRTLAYGALVNAVIEGNAFMNESVMLAKMIISGSPAGLMIENAIYNSSWMLKLANSMTNFSEIPTMSFQDIFELKQEMIRQGTYSYTNRDLAHTRKNLVDLKETFWGDTYRFHAELVRWLQKYTKRGSIKAFVAGGDISRLQACMLDFQFSAVSRACWDCDATRELFARSMSGKEYMLRTVLEATRNELVRGIFRMNWIDERTESQMAMDRFSEFTGCLNTTISSLIENNSDTPFDRMVVRKVISRYMPGYLQGGMDEFELQQELEGYFPRSFQDNLFDSLLIPDNDQR